MSDRAEFCPHDGIVERSRRAEPARACRAAGTARRSLRIAASMAVALWALHVVFAIVRGQVDGVILGTAALVVLATGVILAVAAYSKREETLVGTGCFYLVATSLAVSIVEQHAGLGAGIGAGVSWNAIWVAFFPLMVPCAPDQTLAKSLTAATMTPFAFVLCVVLPGRPIGAPVELLALFVPVYLAAFLAWSLARVLSRLEGEITEAKSVGRYELLERIGHGGMGEVYKARHRMLARPVALKLVKRRDGDDTTQLARFRREARAMGRLKSPHTVELLDFGATEDGRLFYAMELLEGLDLERLVKQHGPLPPRRVVHVLTQALRSLEEAHRRGMVHRDIKPANLHLGRYGIAHDHVNVLDFGLVKSADGHLSLGPSLTADDRISGTPAYMAPESLVGDGEVDGRADVYSLACVAVYLLTGERVFDADDVIRAAVAHVTEEPTAPSARGVEVPPALEALIMSGLEKDPVRRPDAATFAQLLDGLDLEPWTQEEARRWWADERPFPATRASDAPPTASTPSVLSRPSVIGHA